MGSTTWSAYASTSGKRRNATIQEMLAYADRLVEALPQSIGVRSISFMSAFVRVAEMLAYADRLVEALPQSIGVRSISCMSAFVRVAEMLAYVDRVVEPLPQSVGVRNTFGNRKHNKIKDMLRTPTLRGKGSTTQSACASISLRQSRLSLPWSRISLLRSRLSLLRGRIS